LIVESERGSVWCEINHPRQQVRQLMLSNKPLTSSATIGNTQIKLDKNIKNLKGEPLQGMALN